MAGHSDMLGPLSVRALVTGLRPPLKVDRTRDRLLDEMCMMPPTIPPSSHTAAASRYCSSRLLVWNRECSVSQGVDVVWTHASI